MDPLRSKLCITHCTKENQEIGDSYVRLKALRRRWPSEDRPPLHNPREEKGRKEKVVEDYNSDHNESHTLTAAASHDEASETTLGRGKDGCCCCVTAAAGVAAAPTTPPVAAVAVRALLMPVILADASDLGKTQGIPLQGNGCKTRIRSCY
jgi:hypothetical protein